MHISVRTMARKDVFSCICLVTSFAYLKCKPFMFPNPLVDRKM